MGAWDTIKDIGKKIVNTFKKLFRIGKEFLNRLLDLFSFFASLLGIRPKKYLRLKVYILLNQESAPVQTKQEVKRWLDLAKSIFWQKANIRMVTPTAGEDSIEVTFPAVPGYALNHDCSFFGGFGDASEYFEDYIKNNHVSDSSLISIFADFLGYGESIFAFIVESIPGKLGCAWPLIHDFCTVTKEPKSTSLAHEIAHMCGLGDRSSGHNLMSSTRDDMHARLTRWQISVIRNSKYVTYLKR